MEPESDIRIYIQALSPAEVESYISDLGMGLDEMNQLTDLLGHKITTNWIKCTLPSRVIGCYVAAMHLVSWIPFGSWKILHLNNSNAFSDEEIFILNRLFFGDYFDKHKSFSSTIFHNTGNDLDNKKIDLLIGYSIFLLLLFEAHGYLIFSLGGKNNYLSIEDGFAYIHYDDHHSKEVQLLAKSMRLDTLNKPEWLINFSSVINSKLN